MVHLYNMQSETPKHILNIKKKSIYWYQGKMTSMFLTVCAHDEVTDSIGKLGSSLHSRLQVISVKNHPSGQEFPDHKLMHCNLQRTHNKQFYIKSSQKGEICKDRRITGLRTTGRKLIRKLF